MNSEVIITIATISIPFILSGIGWIIAKQLEANRLEQNRRFEERQEQDKYIRELEEKLREDRFVTYNKVLEPYIILFMKPEIFEKYNKGKKQKDIAEQLLLSRV
jgi:hypothetical protein